MNIPVSFRDIRRYVLAFIATCLFVFISVALSGFPDWEFKGPFNVQPSEYPIATCLVIAVVVMFITVMVFDTLAEKPFVGTAALNGFAYNSTLLNWVSEGTRVKRASSDLEVFPNAGFDDGVSSYLYLAQLTPEEASVFDVYDVIFISVILLLVWGIFRRIIYSVQDRKAFSYQRKALHETVKKNSVEIESLIKRIKEDASGDIQQASGESPREALAYKRRTQTDISAAVDESSIATRNANYRELIQLVKEWQEAIEEIEKMEKLIRGLD